MNPGGFGKEKSPDTTPGFFNNTLFFGWVTTPNDFSLPDCVFWSCHQCWGREWDGLGGEEGTGAASSLIFTS